MKLQKLLKDPFYRIQIILGSIVIIEIVAFIFLPRLMSGATGTKIAINNNLPIVIIQLLNSGAAYYYSYKAMLTYDPSDYHRKIWRFVMLSMFFLMLGNFISIVCVYIFGIDVFRPPSLADWFGHLWVLPLLLIAISREYYLVKTASPPNKIMKIGLPAVLIGYAIILAFVSPFLAPGSITIPSRFISIWNIGFAFACMIVSIAVLSEIYQGLLSRSWKIIIMAILFFSVNYALFQFISANRIGTGNLMVSTFMMIFSQIGSFLIILASYVETKMVKFK